MKCRIDILEMKKNRKTDSLLERHLYANIAPKEVLHDELGNALQYLSREYAHLPTSAESPVFIFSAGWRSGSTLVQRLINSDANMSVFGEAFEHMLLWNQMANQWSRFSHMDRLHSKYIPEEFCTLPAEKIHQEMVAGSVANLSPTVAHLKQAHYQYFNALFKDPCLALGRQRWGLKLVRSDANVARYFSWLYPQAKFVFLCRHPLDAWKSYESAVKNSKQLGWYLCVPHHVVENLYQFLLNWRRLTSGFLDIVTEVGGIFIKYEEIISNNYIDELESYLGIHLDRSVLQHRAGQSKAKSSLKDEEIEMCEYVCGDLIRELYIN